MFSDWICLSACCGLWICFVSFGRGMVTGEEVLVIPSVLDRNELAALRKECDALYSTMTMDQLACCSCAVDLFESSEIADDSPVRLNPSLYFEERWKNRCNISFEEKKLIEGVVGTKLPQLLAAAIHTRQLFLFNEHYVVKPPCSELTFRWHTDCEEQLQCLESRDAVYYSLWCPLDDVCEHNGTLVVPVDSTIKKAYWHDRHDTDPVCSLSSDIMSCDSNHQPGIRHQLDTAMEAPGRAIIAGAGSVVLFPSNLLHCSGPNQSSELRRVFYCQYSQDVITSGVGSAKPNAAAQPLCYAVTCTLANSDLVLQSISSAENDHSVVISTSLFESCAASNGSCEEKSDEFFDTFGKSDAIKEQNEQTSRKKRKAGALSVHHIDAAESDCS